jgi:hypothetical protein
MSFQTDFINLLETNVKEAILMALSELALKNICDNDNCDFIIDTLFNNDKYKDINTTDIKKLRSIINYQISYDFTILENLIYIEEKVGHMINNSILTYRNKELRRQKMETKTFWK